MPNATVDQLDFGRLGQRVIEANFEAGALSSDGGFVLLGQVERKLGLSEAVGAALHGPRHPDQCTHHALRDLVAQRLYGLCCGYEDFTAVRVLRQSNPGLRAAAQPHRWGQTRSGRDGPLTSRSINGDGRTLDIQRIEQLGNGFDLVALVRGSDLPQQGQPCGIVPGRHQVHHRLSTTLRAAHTLAVDGNVLAFDSGAQLAHPVYETGFKLSGREQTKYATEGVVRGDTPHNRCLAKMILDPTAPGLCFWKDLMGLKCCRVLNVHRKGDNAMHAVAGTASRLAAKANPRDTPGINCGLRLASQPAAPTLSHVQLPGLG